MRLISLVAVIKFGMANEVDDSDGLCLIQVSAQPSRVVSPAAAALLAVNVSSPHKGALRHYHVSPVSLLHVLVPYNYNHISVNVSYANLQEEIETFPKRRPREFNIILATCKTWLADLIVQFLTAPAGGGSWKFDYRRSMAFAFFGFLYVGLTQWLLYVTVLTWLFPDALIFANSEWSMKLTDREGQVDMLGQVIVDNFIFNVFIYFPAFYLIKSFLQADGTVMFRVKDAMYKYSQNLWQDNVRSCSLWIPMDFFVFACPMYMRMPLEHGVSFGWTMFMSFTRGAGKGPEAKAAAQSKPDLCVDA